MPAPIQACVFDAYGTLFDVHSAVGRYAGRMGTEAATLSETWRRKQLEYTWVRTLCGVHADFLAVTGESLDHALAAAGIPDPELRADLLQAYRNLDPYAEVREVLEKLEARGLRRAILSNGSPDMLADAVRTAGLGQLLDPVLSVESIGVYKPDRRVYALAGKALDLDPQEICFVSANAWDAAGAARFGFRVAWLNRAAAPREYAFAEPDTVIASLAELPSWLAVEAPAS
jgi:2-haloacid dehalogenase